MGNAVPVLVDIDNLWGMDNSFVPRSVFIDNYPFGLASMPSSAVLRKDEVAFLDIFAVFVFGSFNGHCRMDLRTQHPEN